ncbi:MAG: phage baseplate assembly protein V [Planctomycetota bacterium]
MIPSELRRHVGKYYGKYSGEVTDNEDEGQRGLIRVKVPAVFGDELVATARPCLPTAHFFVPDVGARVWVEFEAGDPRHPIWVGTWYAEDEPPEESRLTPPSNRVIHTNAGHTIEISDEAGEEKITIKHKENAFLSIDPNGSVTISDSGGSHIYLNADAAEATMMSQHGHLVTMTDGGLALVNKDGSAFDLQGDVARITASNIVLDGQNVAIGNGAGPTDQVVKATPFSQLWQMFLTHTHATAMGPSGPPLPPVPMVPAQHYSSVMVK